MIQEILIEKLKNKKVKDYSFTIIFFVTFSFFVLFVIRPNLVSVFSLQRDLEDLKLLDKQYGSAVASIVSIQSSLEKNRDLFPLLDQALPSSPKVHQVIEDINKVASESGFMVDRVDIYKVSLKEDEITNVAQNYLVSLETTSSFEDVNEFIALLLQQRRLKMIKNLSIAKDTAENMLNISSDSSKLKIQLQIKGYYQ